MKTKVFEYIVVELSGGEILSALSGTKQVVACDEEEAKQRAIVQVQGPDCPMDGFRNTWDIVVRPFV